MTEAYPINDRGEKTPSQNRNSVCYIVGAGVLDENYFEFINKGLLIAADGGYSVLKKLGITPDYLIGDLDSLDNIPEDVPTEAYSKEKDETDMMLAINKGFDLGFNTFAIYGGLGGRLDHSMANIQLLNYISTKNARGYLIQGEKIITVITNDDYKIKAQKKGYISVLSLTQESKGVNIKGLKFILNQATLSNYYPVGISNEFIDQDAFIDVEEGSLMIIWNSPNPEKTLFTDAFET